MSYLLKLSSRVEAVLRSGHLRAKTSLYGADSCSWSRRMYTSKTGSSNSKSVETRSPNPKTAMIKDIKEKKKKKKYKPSIRKGAFYVVRRGDVIGFYTSLDDCQAQVGSSSSICHSAVTVFKGYDLPKNSKEYLATRGLMNPIYSINAVELKEDILGSLVQYSLADLASAAKDTLKKRSQKDASGKTEVYPPISTEADLYQMHAKLTHPDINSSSNDKSCILKFDGASKGNPGKSGAGAVLQAPDNSLICTLREGCGSATNNVAGYRALRLGLKIALEQGFNRISVQGDSQLVCMQVLGCWKVKNKDLGDLHKEVMNLKNQFVYFQIGHVLKVLNSEADAVATRAITLYKGEAVMETPD